MALLDCFRQPFIHLLFMLFTMPTAVFQNQLFLTIILPYWKTQTTTRSVSEALITCMLLIILYPIFLLSHHSATTIIIIMRRPITIQTSYMGSPAARPTT